MRMTFKLLINPGPSKEVAILKLLNCTGNNSSYPTAYPKNVFTMKNPRAICGVSNPRPVVQKAVTLTSTSQPVPE